MLETAGELLVETRNDGPSAEVPMKELAADSRHRRACGVPPSTFGRGAKGPTARAAFRRLRRVRELERLPRAAGGDAHLGDAIDLFRRGQESLRSLKWARK
jgi:hypothetical protein